VGMEGKGWWDCEEFGERGGGSMERSGKDWRAYRDDREGMEGLWGGRGSGEGPMGKSGEDGGPVGRSC